MTAALTVLTVTRTEDGKVTAEGRLPNGRDYFAVACDVPRLRAQVDADATADRWTGWALRIPATV